jgi:hypothetical protein
VRGNIAGRLLEANLISGSASAVLVRRACLEQVGTFDESLVCAEDWDLWLRIAEHYAFDCVEETLVWLRQHPGNAQKNEVRMLGGQLLFLNKLLVAGKLRWHHLESFWERLAAGGHDGRDLQGFPSCAWRLRLLVSGLPLKVLVALIRSSLYQEGLGRSALKLFYRLYPHVPGFIRRPLKRIWLTVRTKGSP